MKLVQILAVICLLSYSKAVFAQQKLVDRTIDAAIQQASADQIKADITYLADDKLKGREPGKAGFRLAVDYVTAQLKAYGVKPAGENNGWLQTVRMRRAFLTGDNHAVFHTGEETWRLAAGKEIAVYPNPGLKSSQLNSAVVFAGYGITDPSLNYDDYKGIDVKEKIVLIVRGAPRHFPSSDAAHSQNLVTIQKNAVKHGAVGVIMAPADSLTLNVPDFSHGVNSVLDKKGAVAVSATYTDRIEVTSVINYPCFSRIVKSAGKEVETTLEALKNGRPQSFPTPITMEVVSHSMYEDFISFNIAGKIEGSDPVLKNEYVVHSAHLDHVGTGVPVEGDSIYNGAHDNASGVASLLQIAHIYKAVKHKPKRSVIILMVTGEEMGLLGSGYYASYPTVPANKIVADVNTDMPTIIAPLLSVTPIGAEHSSLSVQVDAAAAYFGLTVEPDPEPAQNRFVRSDQYSFVKLGIPALHIKYGNKTADGKNNLNETVVKWRAKYYHKPQDDINGVFDFEAGKKYAQLNFLIGYLVANATERPVWNEGDVFAHQQ
jgi:hypothetical protein